MFSTKQKDLLKGVNKSGNNENKEVVTNAFLNAGREESAKTLSGNGALRYNDSGNDFLNQFASLSHYKTPRVYSDIASDMAKIYYQDKQKTIALILYMRGITRKVQYVCGSESSTVQRGQGLKHEAIMRMIWLAVNDEENFWNNIYLFIAFGSWKDIITMLSYDVQYNGWEGKVLNWEKMFVLILSGLENDNTSDLVKKYLPQIKAVSKCKTLSSQADTIIGKYFASQLFNKDVYKKETRYKFYRQLKTSGKAHEWQKLISKKLLNEIDFSTIHGRALSLIVSSKFIKNNNLEDKYEEWIKKQPIAKFTGFPYELLCKVNHNYKKYQIDTVNKQFMGLVKTGKKDLVKNDLKPLIVALDVSDSMNGVANGTKFKSIDIASSFAVYFSYMLEGVFADHYFTFSTKTKLNKFSQETPVEKFKSCGTEYQFGDTNIQGVIDQFIVIKQKGVSEEDFPCGILTISDGEFDPTYNGKPNFQVMKEKLINAGFSKEFVNNFKFILWDITNNYYSNSKEPKFETFGDHTNAFYMSGFDPSGLAFLTGTATQAEKEQGTPKNAEELMEAALSQEIMDKIVVS